MTHNRLGHRFQRRLDVPVWLERGPQGLAYSDKVLGYSPIRYFPLWDSVGSPNAEELVVGDDGTYNGPTLGQDGIGDGNTCPLFDGLNDRVDIYSAALAAAFNPSEGTESIWIKVSGVGVWTDGSFRTCNSLGVAGLTSYVFIRRSSANNILTASYNAAGTIETINFGPTSTVDWLHAAITWSVAADEVKFYVDAIIQGTATTLGVWAGALGVNQCPIGVLQLPTVQPWSGYEAHYSIFDSALAQPAISDLATV